MDNPNDSYSKMLGISKKEQSHSIYSVDFWLINVCALQLVQRQVQSKDSDIET